MLCILIDFLQCDVVSRLNNNDAGVPDPIRVVWFFFVLFFFIRPTEPKSGNAFEAKRKKSAVDEVSFVSHRSILSSDSKVELHTEWIVLCESTAFTWLCSLQIYKLHVTTEQGWRSGESTHLPPMSPGFKSWRRRHMWVEFVVDSLP